jgi:hypothetical protein
MWSLATSLGGGNAEVPVVRPRSLGYFHPTSKWVTASLDQLHSGIQKSYFQDLS